tara:strand:- start:276 stop:377 length:102 start_codon:yes stop_codon:yes gene_type:complete
MSRSQLVIEIGPGIQDQAYKQITTMAAMENSIL